MDILRFITAGNVDDGKSTLIGRLLYDTDNIKEDILQSVLSESGTNNLAHITDGLRTERQQGITIDVAYKYFTTKHRKYIITDAPGHFQYTRNLVTGASNVDLMIVLIDAVNGITEQTKRHSLVASFLKTGYVVVTVNKMDAVGYGEQVFTIIKDEYLEIAKQLGLRNLTFIPISALEGDNVSSPSENMQWYSGETLMQYLENCTPLSMNSDAVRFSVQSVIEEHEKGYAGKILSGSLRVGDVVGVFPEKEMAVISKIIHGYSEVVEATAGQNIVVYFEGLNNAKRGDIVAYFYNAPKCSNEFEATVCWLDANEPLKIGKEYFLNMISKWAVCTVTEVMYKMDVGSFEKYKGDFVSINELARVKIETKEMLAYDEYAILPENGRGIIIDTKTNYTSGAFVIEI